MHNFIPVTRVRFPHYDPALEPVARDPEFHVTVINLALVKELRPKDNDKSPVKTLVFLSDGDCLEVAETVAEILGGGYPAGHFPEVNEGTPA